MSKQVNRVILNISGTDRPGVTSMLTQEINQEDAQLIDLGQSVLHGFLTLSAIIDIPEGSSLLQNLLSKTANSSLKLELLPSPEFDTDNKSNLTKSLVLTLIGPMQDGRALSELTKLLAKHKANIEEIRTLSDGSLQGVELIAYYEKRKESALMPALRQEVFPLAESLNLDIALQANSVYRRNKRLVCLDVDSTFVQMEVIDELAVLNGAGQKVKKITEEAMQGKIDFSQSLKQRVACLQGLSVEKAHGLLKDIPLSAGAEKLVRSLKKLGYRVGLVSGGFDFFVEELKKRYGLDFAFANTLAVSDGKFNGELVGSIVDPMRKAQVLKDMAQIYKCRMAQTIAIGDGANDIEMLKCAGLGIAYRAKQKLKSAADSHLQNSELNQLLFLMGFRAPEIRELQEL